MIQLFREFQPLRLLRPSRPRSPRRPLLIGALFLLTLSLPSVQGQALAVGTADADRVTGQAAEPSVHYRVLDFDWTDATRQRVVPVRLYLPDAASSDHPVPLVVFSHGIGGSRNGYSYLGKYWANQGIASLHLQHVGSDRSLWSGNPLALSERLQKAAQDSEAIARAEDHHFALERLLAQADLGPRIDTGRIVAAGHSYGANTTMLVAGASVERDGRLLNYANPRIKAAIILSAPPFYGSSDPQRILGDMRVPTLHITATEDVIRVPGYFSGAADRIAIYDSTATVSGVRKILAVFDGGSHSIFTDRGGTGGALLNPKVKEATRELSLAFLKSVFDGDDGALEQWPQRFAPILSRFSAEGRYRRAPRN